MKCYRVSEVCFNVTTKTFCFSTLPKHRVKCIYVRLMLNFLKLMMYSVVVVSGDAGTSLLDMLFLFLLS